MTTSRLAFCLVVCLPLTVHAGLHYSEEKYAELPARWRGFLLDQRALRQIAVPPSKEVPASLLRQQYQREAERLSQLENPTADEIADLGALWVRLGEPAKAVEVLRPAVRRHPGHFRLAANLGTAWQMQGDLPRAAEALAEAVRLAPDKQRKLEELHLKLVRARMREKPGTQSLDALFEVTWIDSTREYLIGRFEPAVRKVLTPTVIAQVQQLALWLPADGRLLWLLAELANGYGDVGIAAAIMDGCVTEFGLRDPQLLAHRKRLREAVAAADKKQHEEHVSQFEPRSARPLLSKASLAALPPIDRKGTNSLAWEVLAETTLDRQLRPTFAKYLRDLDGLQVEMRGFMQPLGEDTDLGAFMLVEHPIGCWFCEMPELTSIMLVELPEGKSGRFTRERIRVTGRLMLNANDPENFLYTLREAKVRDDLAE